MYREHYVIDLKLLLTYFVVYTLIFYFISCFRKAKNTVDYTNSNIESDSMDLDDSDDNDSQL